MGTAGATSRVRAVRVAELSRNPWLTHQEHRGAVPASGAAHESLPACPPQWPSSSFLIAQPTGPWGSSQWCIQSALLALAWTPSLWSILIWLFQALHSSSFFPKAPYKGLCSGEGGTELSAWFSLARLWGFHLAPGIARQALY